MTSSPASSTAVATDQGQTTWWQRVIYAGRIASLISAGNVFTAGIFNNTADFDPGVGVANLTSAGGTNSFISKLSQNNAPPAIIAPHSVTVVEDIATTITGISFADVDAGSSAVTATFKVATGSLSAIASGGVTVVGTASALTLTGSIANLNAFITAGNLKYQTRLNSNTALTLGVDINDNGNSYAPAQTASTNVTINITSSLTPSTPITLSGAIPIFTVLQSKQTLILSRSTQKLLVSQPVALQQLFDEAYYLRQNPDVYAAYARGVFQSGFQHFFQYGQYEGRNPSSLYNEQYYLNQNPDVAAAVARSNFRCGFQHFLRHGEYEGRNPSSLYNEQSYLSQNQDVALRWHGATSAVASSISCSMDSRKDG